MLRPSASASRWTVALLALLLVVAGGIGPVAPAAAATAPRILVQRLDPLQSRPVVVQVAVLDGNGSPVPFRGTVTLAVARTKAAASVSSTDGAVAVARIDTTLLRDGLATLRAVLVVAGRSRTQTLRWFAEIAAPVHVTAFSCAAVTPGGGTIRWAVDRMDGEPVPTPNSRDVPLLPYVRSSAARWLMTGPDGASLPTSGSMTLLRGRTTVAVRRLPRQVRRLVFGVTWDGRVRGAFRTGAYTARLVLRDALGGTATAQQPVVVVAKGTGPCGR